MFSLFLRDSIAAITAQQEAEAFGEARDNQPFWMARANGLSNDPAQRVILYGYEDSNTVFIRGLPRDVQRVKDLIAEFDRPAPQARITLWTLQMNSRGSDPRHKNAAFNNAIKTVDDTLRDLRGNLNGVQDILRNSITREVNRVAYIVEKATFPRHDDFRPVFQDRMARYFYYAEEVRRSLGFEFEVPWDLYRLETAHTELRLATEGYIEAKQNHVAAAQYVNKRSERDRLRQLRDSDLRAAEFHLEMALNSLAQINPNDLNMHPERKIPDLINNNIVIG